MALSNKNHKVVMTTGNKSEMSMGYATLYGDMAGGFSVLKDVPKMMVFRLATFRNNSRNRVSPAIPQRGIGLVNRNEYKRRQSSPGVRISRRAFGRDRRYPITSGYDREQ